jgi:Tfp pilus assembly protein PilW
MNIDLIKNLKFKIKNCNGGFTLIEILIFMGIFSILIVALFEMFIAIFDVQLESQSVSSVVADGRYITNKLTADINNATGSAIISPAIGSTGSSLVIFDGTTTFTYATSSGKLNLTNSTLGSTDQLNSTNSAVTQVSFFRLADTKSKNINTITVTFTLNSVTKKRSGAVTQTFVFTAGTR